MTTGAFFPISTVMVHLLNLVFPSVYEKALKHSLGSMSGSLGQNIYAPNKQTIPWHIQHETLLCCHHRQPQHADTVEAVTRDLDKKSQNAVKKREHREEKLWNLLEWRWLTWAYIYIEQRSALWEQVVNRPYVRLDRDSCHTSSFFYYCGCAAFVEHVLAAQLLREQKALNRHINSKCNQISGAQQIDWVAAQVSLIHTEASLSIRNLIAICPQYVFTGPESYTVSARNATLVVQQICIHRKLPPTPWSMTYPKFSQVPGVFCE